MQQLGNSRSIGKSQDTVLRLLAVLLIVATFAATLHSHLDTDSNSAKHCPSCSVIQAAAPAAFASVATVRFPVAATVVRPRSRVASLQPCFSLYVRPPPAV